MISDDHAERFLSDLTSLLYQNPQRILLAFTHPLFGMSFFFFLSIFLEYYIIF